MDYTKITKNEIINQLNNTITDRDNLKSELTVKTTELQELRRLYDTLKSSSASSSMVKTSLDKQVKTLTDDRDKTKIDLSNLQTNYAKIQESFTELSSHSQELENIRDRLIKENTDIKQQYGIVYNEYKEYRVYSESLLKALQGSLELGIDLLYKTSGEKYNKGE